MSDPVRGAFVRASADLDGGFSIDEILKAGLEQAAEDIVVSKVRVGEDFRNQGRQGRTGGESSPLLATPQEFTPH